MCVLHLKGNCSKLLSELANSPNFQWKRYPVHFFVLPTEVFCNATWISGLKFSWIFLMLPKNNSNNKDFWPISPQHARGERETISDFLQAWTQKLSRCLLSQWKTPEYQRYLCLHMVNHHLCSSFIRQRPSTVFHSINSPDNSSFSDSVLPVLSLPYWSLQLWISWRKSSSALI